MARELGISAMYISELENGKKIPLRGEKLPQIGVYLGLDPAELVKMAFSEKSDEETAKIQDDLSLSVARKTMEIKDPEMLKRILRLMDGGTE
jgi:transcriptional regulator with XRE-family HTH domain